MLYVVEVVNYGKGYEHLNEAIVTTSKDGKVMSKKVNYYDGIKELYKMREKIEMDVNLFNKEIFTLKASKYYR